MHNTQGDNDVCTYIYIHILNALWPRIYCRNYKRRVIIYHLRVRFVYHTFKVTLGFICPKVNVWCDFSCTLFLGRCDSNNAQPVALIRALWSLRWGVGHHHKKAQIQFGLVYNFVFYCEWNVARNSALDVWDWKAEWGWFLRTVLNVTLFEI